VDALVTIHWKEGVCTDWLPTGDGLPFCVRYLTDEDEAALLSGVGREQVVSLSPAGQLAWALLALQNRAP